jgi:hypothetical protein
LRKPSHCACRNRQRFAARALAQHDARDMRAQMTLGARALTRPRFAFPAAPTFAMASPSAAAVPPTSPPGLPDGEAFLTAVFHYHPDEAAAWAAFALFFAIMLVNLGLTLCTRRGASYLYFITATGVLELVGYGTRVLTVQRQQLNLLIITQLFIILAPIAVGKNGSVSLTRRRCQAYWCEVDTAI